MGPETDIKEAVDVNRVVQRKQNLLESIFAGGGLDGKSPGLGPGKCGFDPRAPDK